ncbi:MAG: hypothetical protein J6C42_11505 [Clostridia bacterium]|nr:hypothetical protein [Clostridia bacterium]MBP3695185.1 hypothetical protein [Thermoguttaceae bacterium]
MDNLSVADIAAVTDKNYCNMGYGGFGGGWGNDWTMIILFALIFGNGFGGFGGNRGFGENLATEGTVQRGFDHQTTTSKLDNLAYGIANAGYETARQIDGVNTNILTQFGELSHQIAACCCDIQRGIDSVNYNGAINTANIIQAQERGTQKILDAICGNRMADMQNQINQLQLQAALCGVVRYPTATTFSAQNPFCFNSGCGCNGGY